MINKFNFIKRILSATLITLCVAQYAFAGNDSTDRQTIFNAINAFRAEHGLSKLTLNETISRVAEQHSQDMADHATPFGHEGFGGRVRTLFRDFKHPRGAAENVAFIYKHTDEVVDMWLNSSGHRRNIEGNFNLTGIGIAHDQHGRVYVTQIFIRANDKG